MVRFTSDRERRLWLAALAVVVAIYSTLGLARTLAGVLREQGLLEASFALGMVLVAAAVVALAVRARVGGREVAVGLGVAAAYLLVFVRMATPEERTHLLEYGVVAALVHEALRERASQGRRGPRPAVVAILVTAAVGVLDECIQALLPSRVFDPRDILFNVLAAVMAVGAAVAFRWARRRARNRAAERARRRGGTSGDAPD